MFVFKYNWWKSPHLLSPSLGFLPAPCFKVVSNLRELTRASGHFHCQFTRPLCITQPCGQFPPLGTLSSLSLGDMALTWLWSSCLNFPVCIAGPSVDFWMFYTRVMDPFLYSLPQRFPSDLCLSLYSDASQVYFLQPETNHGAQATDTLLTLKCLIDT